MKSKTAGIIALALALFAVLAVPAAAQEVYFVPKDTVVPYPDTAQVEIWINAGGFQSGGINMSYNPGCANVTKWMLDTANFPLGTWGHYEGNDKIGFVGFALKPAGVYRVGTLTIQCVCAECPQGCITPLDFLEDCKLVDDYGNAVQVTWTDGTFGCTAKVPVIVSCYANGTESNDFYPAEDVYVRGDGLSANTQYKIWIQNDPIAEGDELISGEDPSGVQELITTSSTGSFDKVLIWEDIPAGPTKYWDIVIDKQGDGTNTGIYNSESDGIDSPTAVGFVVGIGPEPEKIIVSCDADGIEKNEFYPSENVSVKGDGLSANTEYKIWIQNDPVAEGDALIPGEDPSGAQELITTSSTGSFDKVLIWENIPPGPTEYWDIVVDKQDDGINTGIYNSDSDGIDSATAVGFTAPIPEPSPTPTPTPTPPPPSSSQLWYLDSVDHLITGTKTMEKEIGAQSGSVAISAGQEQFWIADEKAIYNVSFTGGFWVIELKTNQDWSGTCSVSVGGWNSTTGWYEILGTTVFSSWNNTILKIVLQASPATIYKDDYLALKVINEDVMEHTVSTNGQSSLRSPNTDPGYPIPELPVLILTGAGLFTLAGYIVLRGKDKKV